MKLDDLKKRTQVYLRDTKGNKFPATTLTAMIFEAVDRVRQETIFSNMPYPDDVTEVSYLPQKYHYLLAVYASSRLFELDNDFYQATQRRNEFEALFAELLDKIDAGEIEIKDNNNTVVTVTRTGEYVVDEYYDRTSSSESELII
jgi:hypothetical protein